MNYDQILEKVCHRTGLDEDRARLALVATLEVLGQRLPEIDASAVGRQLPKPLGDTLAAHDRIESFDIDEFYRRVARHERVPPNFAMEHAQVVCEVLTEAVDEEGRIHLRKDLPEEFAQLFEVRVRPAVPDDLHNVGSGHTLASGRPGSSRPLSEDDVAQRDSVATSDNPHGDTKLSSAKGTTQERLHHTISEGKPGSTRPLADEHGD